MKHGCWTRTPKHHPWAAIVDMACGYDERLVDRKCKGCHRARTEGPETQLQQVRDHEFTETQARA